MMIANDLMTEDPITIGMTARIRDAVRKLHDLDIRHLPVVDESGALVGMLSDRDLRAYTCPEFFGTEYLGNVQTALDAPVSSIMTADVVSVDLEADAAEIIDLIIDLKIGAVPVVDSDDKLVGIVSYIDLLREMPLDDDDDDARPAGRASLGK
jgi:acetoin utilization protein AcuB